MKQCPRCGVGLNETEVGGVSVEGCVGCGGVWFDAKEMSALARESSGYLQTLEDRFWPSVTDLKKREQAVCPNCSEPMVQFEFPHSPGVTLDGCMKCKGIWVDDGELSAIQKRLQQTAAPTPTTPYDTRTRARQALGFLAQADCPGCHQPNPAASPVCWACGAKLPGDRGILCPRCDKPLHTTMRLGVRMDTCQGCGGVWLDGGELSMVLARDPDEIRQLDQDLTHTAGRHATSVSELLLCPLCHVPMEHKPFAGSNGARLDTCDHCRGVFADAGEFTTLAQAAARL